MHLFERLSTPVWADLKRSRGFNLALYIASETATEIHGLSQVCCTRHAWGNAKNNRHKLWLCLCEKQHFFTILDGMKMVTEHNWASMTRPATSAAVGRREYWPLVLDTWSDLALEKVTLASSRCSFHVFVSWRDSWTDESPSPWMSMVLSLYGKKCNFA